MGSVVDLVKGGRVGERALGAVFAACKAGASKGISQKLLTSSRRVAITFGVYVHDSSSVTISR